MDLTRFYRFGLSAGFCTHLWKSATRQDHAHLAAMIARYLPRDGVAIDVGAHGGQITRLMAAIADLGMVVAVEPSGYTRSILRVALWLRRVRNAVVVAVALGARAGAVVIHTPIKTSGAMGYGLANLAGGDGPAVREAVAVVTLDGLAAELGLTRVDFIKADIEGFEGAMIAGGHGVLAKFRPALLLEMDDIFLRRAGTSFTGLWDELVGLGYGAHDSESGAPLAAGGPAPAADVLWLPVPVGVRDLAANAAMISV